MRPKRAHDTSGGRRPRIAELSSKLRKARARGFGATFGLLVKPRIRRWRHRLKLLRFAYAAIRIRYSRRGGRTAIAVAQPAPVITPEYRALNQEMHRTRDGYGVQGQYHVPQVQVLARFLSRDILDYGCGKRLLESGLGFAIQNYDPGIAGLDQPPDPADVVVCLDVLEHIETDCLDAVLSDLARVTLRAGYFVISTVPATKTLPDGRNAHLTVRSPDWWEDWLDPVFRVHLRLHSTDHAEFVVRPRHDSPGRLIP